MIYYYKSSQKITVIILKKYEKANAQKLDNDLL